MISCNSLTNMRWRTILLQYCFLWVSCLLTAFEAVPIDIDKTKVQNTQPVESSKIEPPDTGLYYDEYLKQVIDVLETDKHFREKLQKADIEEIKSGRLSKELDLVSHHVRTKLDELKRQEIGRLRMLIKAKLDSMQDVVMDHQALLKQFDHLNHMNPDKFESTDLDMLIKAATSDLEHYDKSRHEEFKKYEMMKEHERREYLKTLNEEKRKEEESKFQEMKKKHEDHPKVNHPGSKDQLKEVWEETDGLDPNDFDPKTFFKLHDVNSDGFLDEQELEALFTKELEKVYDPKNEEDDMVEMEEERLRMREHVMNEVDTNRDRLVTLEEFLKATEKKEFLEPDSWETLDQQQFFTEEELKEYENMIALQENELKKKADDLQKQKEELQRQHDQLEAQKQEYNQAVQQLEQKKLQQGIAPSGPNGELKFEPRGLEVEMAGRRQTVSLNKNITIICKVPGAPNLDIRTMGIRWFWKNQTSDLEKVFEFIGDHQEAIRPGATVSLWRLKRGDASLQLPAIQLREAGEYRCMVVVTPQKAEGRVWLEVIASPDSKLFWEQSTVNNKEEKHAVCKSSGFYPPNISIRWKKWIQKSAQYQEISENIFTERPVKNEDGTFNITSYLKLKLPVEDTGATYQCVIWHKSWPTSQKLNLTLPRGESEKTPDLLYLWFLSIPVIGLILLALYFVWKRRYRDRWTSGNETY